MRSKKDDLIERVYEMVKRIPKGKVSTYGMIAKSIGLKKVNPRYVGYLLHNNPDSKLIPCHRVVDRNGKVAEKYAFGGWKVQKEKLIHEGVNFIGLKRVDLKRYMV
jgi:methylated-DNA-protein-cysteine methyltransferase-like protein